MSAAALKLLTDVVEIRLERERLMRFLSYVEGWCTNRDDVALLSEAVEECKADIKRMAS